MGPHGVSGVAASPAVAVQVESEPENGYQVAHDTASDRLVPEPELIERTSAQQESAAQHETAIDDVASSLRQHTTRIRTLKVRAEFEYTLLIVLSIHVVYMYYLDHTLLVFLIRASQLIRLLYFPCENVHSQRGTAYLLLLSNLPILAIHRMLFMGPLEFDLGQMIFINFIGAEPTNLFKTLYIDFITIVLQLLLLQCKWHASTLRILSALPVPDSEPLVPIPRNPQLDQDQNSHSTDSPPLT